MLKLKLAAIAAAILLSALLGAWGYEKFKAEKSQRLAAEAAIEEQKQELELARLNTEQLLSENDDLWLSLASWMNRPPVKITNTVYREKIANAPVECRGCLEKYQRPLQFKQKGVTVTIPDALMGDTAEIKIDQGVICQHWIELAGRPGCGGDIHPSDPDVPRLFRRGPIFEVEAGYGIAGTEAAVASYPLEMGSSKFILQVGARASATWRDNGTVDGNVAAGVRLQIK